MCLFYHHNWYPIEKNIQLLMYLEQHVWELLILCIHKICPSNYCTCRIISCIVLLMAGLRMGRFRIFIGAHFPCILLLCAASKIIIWRPIFTKWFFLLYCLFLAKHKVKLRENIFYFFNAIINHQINYLAIADWIKYKLIIVDWSDLNWNILVNEYIF